MRIFSSEKLRELETVTCQKQNISSIDLMEREGSVISCEIISRFMPSQRIVIMAGPSQNGGVALAAARMLFEQGYRKVEVFLFNIGQLSHDCEEEHKKLLLIDGLDYTEVKKKFVPPYLGESDVVVDGLFGAELTEPMNGGFVYVARYINESGAFVISIDVPSGLFSEWNSRIPKRDVIHANMTFSFQLPRLSFFFEENAEVLGDWHLVDLDLDEEKIKETKSDFILVEARNVRPLIKPRNPFSGKRDYGSALFFAGSTGMAGASVLAARGAMRSGAGLATVHGPRTSINIVQTATPEVMFEPDRNEHFISDMTLHYSHQAVCAGPGIGTHETTIDALENLLKQTPKTLVLDADALNCIAKRPTLLPMLPPWTIITPHIGEFDRLFGKHDYAEDRLRTAIEVSKKYNIIIVLKGHYTMVVRPTGRVNVNSTGNAGMATAGAGDVLAGVISAFLAQGYSPDRAALIGVYVHGLAGDMAAEELGEFGVMASDIVNRIGRAIKSVMEQHS